MEIKKENKNGTVNVAVSGRIDTTTAPVFESELKESYDSCDAIALDFADVEYISSAGLRVLLSAQKIMSRKGGMTLRNVGADIMEIFEVTGFSEILTIV